MLSEPLELLLELCLEWVCMVEQLEPERSKDKEDWEECNEDKDKDKNENENEDDNLNESVSVWGSELGRSSSSWEAKCDI